MTHRTSDDTSNLIEQNDLSKATINIKLLFDLFINCLFVTASTKQLI